MDYSLSRRSYLIGTAFLALGCLGMALMAQYFFNVTPCVLCLYERYVYLLIGTLGLTALIPHLKLSSINTLFYLMGLALLVGSILGFYHLGVEEKWWQGTKACQGTLPRTTSLADLRAALTAKPLARCTQVNWRILGISATWLNLLWNLIFLGGWGWLRKIPLKKNPPS